MEAAVEHRPAAGHQPVAAPAFVFGQGFISRVWLRPPQLGRIGSLAGVVGRGGGTAVLVKEAERRTDQTGFMEHPAGGALARLTAVGRGGRKDLAGPLSCLDHQSAGFDGDAERFFAQDVEAGLHAVDGDAVMEAMGQAEVHGVNAGLFEQILVRGVERGADSEQFLQHVGARGRGLLVGVADGGDDEIAAPALLQILHRKRVVARYVPAADQSESNGHQGILTLLEVAAGLGDRAGRRRQAGGSICACMATGRARVGRETTASRLRTCLSFNAGV